MRAVYGSIGSAVFEFWLRLNETLIGLESTMQLGFGCRRILYT
jgi:hypothetical protein